MQCDQCLHVINTAAKSYTPTNPVSRFPPIQEWANTVWPLSSCNVHHESTVSGRGGQYSCTMHFLYMPSCRVTAKLYINRTNSPLLQMVTLNQFYLVKGGPGIIALPSFLYIQSCRVTAFGISLCRISLTNLPLLLHGWYKSHQFAALAVHRCHFLDWEG
jgi:hypothetical protein